MTFRADPPGEGWQALRSPRKTWSEQQLHVIKTAVQEHPGLAAPVRSYVSSWLQGCTPPRWRAALGALPSSPPEDPPGRFACACVLLRFAALARQAEPATAAAMDRYLEAVPYRLPGTLWLRVEQELYIERLAGRGSREAAQDALQILYTRLLRALDTYKPGAALDPDRWVSEILKNIKIDGQRRSSTEARIFEPMNPEEMSEQLLEHHSSAEEEVMRAQDLEIVGQTGEGHTADASREIYDKLEEALKGLSNNMLAVLYLSMFPPPDRDAGIASQLNTSLPNIRKRRHDALKALRRALGNERRREAPSSAAHP